jgi:predicted RNA binding protein YcfA (HicA-like mRNA interferase family)
MSKLGRDLKKLLSQHGCEFVRQGKGDHEIWRSPINGRHFTVDDGVKSRHTANKSLKDAGIDERL